MQKVLGLVFLFGAIVFSIVMISMAVRSNYHYENDYSSYWSLADKASTIAQKSEYIDKFANALDNSGLHGTNNALMYKTNNNAFDTNFEALKSLQTRLEEIKTMKPDSFEYQTAIQQITAQEQGEAKDMLDVFEGCWTKVHYYWLWNPWLVFIQIIMVVFIGMIGAVLLMGDNL